MLLITILIALPLCALVHQFAPLRIDARTAPCVRGVADMRTGTRPMATPRASLQAVKRDYRELRADMYMSRRYPNSRRAHKVRALAAWHFWAQRGNVSYSFLKAA